MTITLLGDNKIELPASKGSGLDNFDVAYFTASCDDPATNLKYAEALQLDYPILSDPGKTVAEAYGVVHEKRQVPERWTFYIGQNGNILHIDKNVNAASHGADVAKTLKNLGID